MIKEVENSQYEEPYTKIEGVEPSIVTEMLENIPSLISQEKKNIYNKGKEKGENLFST